MVQKHEFLKIMKKKVQGTCEPWVTEVPHPQLALSPQSAQECALVHDPPAQWDQVHTLKNVVPAPATVEQPPRKDPRMEYSKIVPQSEQKY
nr:hypothetical protein [Tanacetum cinerariifolium]